jgi:hypothetical protein
MDELKKIIDLTPLSDQEIKDRSVSLSDLWMVKDETDKIFGPFDTESLKVFTGNHQHLFENTQTYNLEDEQWSETFLIPHFQRRRPALVSAQNLISNAEFFVIINDQQNGPYRQDEIQGFLNNGTITSSSKISLDSGESWIKLYEHHAFNRRSKKSNQELPFRPAPEILEHMAKTKEEILQAKEQEEAIIQLAFIGHNKTVPTKEEREKAAQAFEVPKKEKAKETSTHKKKYLVPALAGLALCVMIIAGSFFIDGKSGKEKKLVEAKTDVKSINNSQRSGKRKPASVTKRIKPKKITKRIPKRIAPKRYNPRPKARRRSNARAKRKDVFEQDIEKLDINDPEIQEELTRQLAGEYEMDGERNEENSEEFLDEREERDDGYDGEEDREEHEEY